ncbi:MAG: RHS repeat domain-containing protein, partial [Kiritimatiellia bacterium]
DDWGQLSSLTYSDETPSIAYTYDAMGRQTSATDAVGTTTFAYDVYGQLTMEQVAGLYNKTLLRHKDAFGRSVGYSVDETRQATLHYDDAAFTDNKKAGLMTGLVKW